MKRSMILLAVAFALASTAAIAQDTALEKAGVPTSKAVKLTDAELDNVTAGSAIVGMAVFNAGNAFVFRPTENGGLHCVNCVEPLPGISKLMVVINPAKTVFHCVGAGCP